MFFTIAVVLFSASALMGARPVESPDQILVKPKPGADRNQLEAVHRSEGAQVKKKFSRLGDLQVLRLPPGRSTAAAVRRYEESGLVEYAEPDMFWYASALPNDIGFSYQWPLHNQGQSSGKVDADIDSPEAWDLQSEAGGVIVAVIDTGVNYTHEDLARNMWVNSAEIPGNKKDDDRNGFVDDVHGINAILDSGDPRDDHSHGSHVAGTIGASGNNSKGISGVAWRTQLMALKFLSSSGGGLTSDAITCIDYAVVQGASVINASWGGGGASLALQDAIRRARDAGVIFVAAAGNEQNNNDLLPSFPASYDLENIVSVAATDRYDQLDSRYSNYGAQSVDLGAPGTDILSCSTVDSQYVYKTGTSMAAPHVAGAIALLRARFPQETSLQLIDRVLGSVDLLPSLQGKCATGGRLNLQRALELPPQTTPGLSAPPVLSIVSANPLQLALEGEPGTEYVLQGTEDLRTWTDLSTNTMPAEGMMTYEINRPGRKEIYRAKVN